MLQFVLSAALIILSNYAECNGFSPREATVEDIQKDFRENRVTSRQLVEFYLSEIRRLNRDLKAVIEVNPDALQLADEADRRRKAGRSPVTKLQGIPVLVKDNIATKDKLNTTAGSCALVGSVVGKDAGVISRLRRAGAIILGKASMTEWAAYRSNNLPNGWNARRGQTRNPYVKSADPCGSSTGSAVAVAANMVAVSLGTETAGSILCPSSSNSVVGIKPTVGLTSRAGVVPISPRQDTVGPICRTVSDAVHVLDAIVGFDQDDFEATRKALKFIPRGGYLQFLKTDGLKGKRLGMTKHPLLGFQTNPETESLKTLLRQKGAIVVDNLDIVGFDDALNSLINGQYQLMNAEFKLALNAYLKGLEVSPIRSLADAIGFNKNFSKLEKLKEFGQDTFLAAEKTNGIGKAEREILLNLTKASKHVYEKLMVQHKLDSFVTPADSITYLISPGGYPAINVPAGYGSNGAPVGISFGGLKGSEPKLIEIAYSFEQATKLRKSPPVTP